MNDERLSAAIDMQCMTYASDVLVAEFISDLRHTCELNAIDAMVNTKRIHQELKKRGHTIEPTGCAACGGRIIWHQ